MSAPKIRQTVKEARRMQRRIYDRLRVEPLPMVTVIQDEVTKKVLGVLVDRNAFSRFKTLANLDHAELIDFPLST